MRTLTISEALNNIARAFPQEMELLERHINQQTVQLVALRQEVAELSFYGQALRPGALRVVGEIGRLEAEDDQATDGA
jgi:hypothetical protein